MSMSNTMDSGDKFVAITVHPEGDVSAGDGGAHEPGASAFSVVAADESLKGLVKGRRKDCFRRLGGGAGVAASLASGAERGILGDGADVARRKAAFGSNTYPKPCPKSFFHSVWDALADVFLVVLLVCAAVSLAFGIKEHGVRDGWYDGVSIFLSVFLVAAVLAISNHSQAKLLDRLFRELENITVSVIRVGRRKEVSIFDVVVGDVVVLKIDDVVPADGVFLEGHALQVDESSMDGDPHPVEIDGERSPFLASGVKVVDGYGKMVVTAVGMDTAWGEMMSSITRKVTDPTPLQERLEGLTSSIDKITATFSVMVALFLHSMNIVVIAISEGLRLAVTLTLTFSILRMLGENALVRRLSACETMGNVTAICTDKTGTLTLNQMKVTNFRIGGADRLRSAAAGDVITLLCQGIGLNTTGCVYKADNMSPPEITGSPTEKALLSWAVEELAMDIDALRRRFEAFNSDKKSSGVMVRDAATGAVTAHWKGEAEMVLARCSMYVGADGAARELGVEERAKLEQVINDMAAASLLCIAFAYKQVTDIGDGSDHTKIDDEGLTLLGFVGLKDPCRPEAKSSIETCTKAGIAVKMVTGDNLLTARAIAKECGIISESDPADLVIEAAEFRDMSPEHQLEMADKIRVMARARPSDKLLLVKILKKNKDHVVAVTGDCTNDAQALKKADVRLSMGVHGMELAKESPDIVILNNNFDTVVTVIRWGRCVYYNIQKFIQLRLTVYTTTAIVSFVSVLATNKMLLTTSQLVWGNLMINTMSALALATNTPTKGIMQRPPISRTAPLISNAMWRNLAGQAAFQATLLLALHYLGPYAFGEKANGTMIFNVFVLCQVFDLFNARDIEKKNIFSGVLRSWMFLAIIAATLVLQVLMVELRMRITGTERLGWAQWGACLTIAAMSWPIGWVVKLIPAPKRPFHEIITRRGSSS